MTLMVDVAYAWDDARTALRVIKQLEAFDLFFLETPINIDDLDGYAFISERSPIRIAAGEWQNTHWEFIDLAAARQAGCFAAGYRARRRLHRGAQGGAAGG